MAPHCNNSPTAASGTNPAVCNASFLNPNLNVCFSRKRSFRLSNNHDFDRLLSAHKRTFHEWLVWVRSGDAAQGTYQFRHRKCTAFDAVHFHAELRPLSGKHCPIENFYMTLANNIKFFFSTFSIFFGQQFMRKFDYFNFVTSKPCIR